MSLRIRITTAVAVVSMGLCACEAPSETSPLERASTDHEQGLAVDPDYPVIYDNDGAVEFGYTDIHVMALASAGAIDLRGMVTTSSWGEAERGYAPLADAVVVEERQWLIELARQSGMRNIPDAVAGPSLTFWGQRPASGSIDDTVPFGSTGAWHIVNEAHRCSPERPLIIVMGGEATAVVDAYLLDPSIADKMLLVWYSGHIFPDGRVTGDEYNTWKDPWAAYVAFERLRVLAIPPLYDWSMLTDRVPFSPKSRLPELPDTPIREHMINAYLDRGGWLDDFTWANDSPPLVAIMRDDFIWETRTMSFSHWEQDWFDPSRSIPTYVDDPNGNPFVMVTNPDVATEEFWTRMNDPAVWGET